jgi:hypothetical protein
MNRSVGRTAIMLGGYICVFLLAQPMPRGMAQQVVQNGVAAAAATGTQKARVCISTGGGIQAGASPTWSIQVSSSGGSCTHARHYTGPIGPAQIFDLRVPPTHGQVTQQVVGIDRYVSYTPTAGYRGPDSFTLVIPSKSIHLDYTVEVVP